MNTSELITDAFGRVADAVHGACEGLSADQLAWRADPEANTIAWLVWHLARVQDDHVSAVAGRDQVYRALGWHDRFALPFLDQAIGYGFTAEQVGLVQVASADVLTGYYDAVHQATVDFVSGLSDGDLDQVVDTSWDPPVTLGVRLVSVVTTTCSTPAR